MKNRAEFEFKDLPNDARYVISQQFLKQLNLFFVTPDMYTILTSLLVDFIKSMGEVYEKFSCPINEVYALYCLGLSRHEKKKIIFHILF